MKFKLEIDMGNAAFEDRGAGQEIADILTHLAEQITPYTEKELSGSGLFDHNGNKVGQWRVTK